MSAIRKYSLSEDILSFDGECFLLYRKFFDFPIQQKQFVRKSRLYRYCLHDKKERAIMRKMIGKEDAYEKEDSKYHDGAGNDFGYQRAACSSRKG